jgi:hypothetical protein
MLMILVIIMNSGASAWEDESSPGTSKTGQPGPADKTPLPGGVDSLNTPLPPPPIDLIPPPSPEPSATKKIGLEIPPISSTGPSAPLAPSPAPGVLPPLGKDGTPSAPPRKP